MKMKRIVIILLIAVGLLFTFNDCKKKYPEDGKRSWKQPQKRLLKKTWTLKEYWIGGEDSTYTIYTSTSGSNTISWTYYDLTMKFSTDVNELTGEKKVVVKSTSNVGFNSPSYWAWDSDQNKIKIVANFYAYSGWGFRLFNTNDDIWTIRKLTDKEFILEANSQQNKLLRIKFQ